MSVCVCSRCSSVCVPSTIVAGEFKSWTWTLCDYPADEYELQLRFRGPSAGFDVDATADGTAFVIEHAFDDEMTAGKWVWQAWIAEIADPNNIFLFKRGTLTVEVGFVEDDEGIVEVRTPNEIALASIDAAMTAFATSDVLEYEISTPAGSRRVKRSARSDLMNLRKYYAQLVSLERTRDRLRNGGSLMKSVGIVVRGN